MAKGKLALAILAKMGPKKADSEVKEKEEGGDDEAAVTAGEELKSALESGDGKAIYDAVKAILDI